MNRNKHFYISIRCKRLDYNGLFQDDIKLIYSVVKEHDKYIKFKKLLTSWWLLVTSLAQLVKILKPGVYHFECHWF